MEDVVRGIGGLASDYGQPACHNGRFKIGDEDGKSLNLTHEWDKVFPLSNKVNHRKVTFTNRYGITLAADMYVPKQAEGKLPAIAVSGPFGAVKEQSSGLYAMTLAERGFLTIAFDPRTPVRVGANPAMWRLRTSIRRTSVRRWTSFLPASR